MPRLLSPLCSFLRGAERKATTLGVILEGSWVDTLKDVAPRRPHRQSRSLWENVCQMNIDSRRRKDGVQSHQESSGNNREQSLGGNDVRRKPRPITGHRKKTRFPQNCSAGAQIESRILDNDPGVFHSFTVAKCRFACHFDDAGPSALFVSISSRARKGGRCTIGSSTAPPFIGIRIHNRAYWMK